MIKVTLFQTRVMTQGGVEVADLTGTAYLAHERIDTVTELTDDYKKANKVPLGAQACIRYDCRVSGYRLLYVEEDGAWLAKARRREIRGEDSSGPEYSIEPM